MLGSSGKDGTLSHLGSFFFSCEMNVFTLETVCSERPVWPGYCLRNETAKKVAGRDKKKRPSCEGCLNALTCPVKSWRIMAGILRVENVYREHIVKNGPKKKLVTGTLRANPACCVFQFPPPACSAPTTVSTMKA